VTVAVSLRDLVDELQMHRNESNAYLNKVSGKVITITDDDIAVVEMDNELEGEVDDANSGSIPSKWRCLVPPTHAPQEHTLYRVLRNPTREEHPRGRCADANR
jgi:hypothetical protein